MKSKASEIVVEAKRSGKAALNKISEFMGVKENYLTKIHLH